MRVDAHQHFWDYNAADYGWIGADMDVLRRDFRPEDLGPLLAAGGFDGAVAVQARQSESETRWLLELADRHDFLLGVVGWVDLCHPDVASRLDALAHPKLRGIRHVLQDEKPDFMLRPEFRTGVAQLADRGLTYDLLVYPEHLPRAVEFASTLPRVPFVLDHIGKPPIRGGAPPPAAWVTAIRHLAALPHVMCKVSGLVTEAAWQDQPAAAAIDVEEFAPFLRVIFDAFGPQRLMFGSDWPVCLLAADHASVVRLIDHFMARLGEADGLSPEERVGVFGRNAARFYGLENP